MTKGSVQDAVAGNAPGPMMRLSEDIHTKATIVKAQLLTKNKYHTRKLILDRERDSVGWMERSASFRLGIASCFFFGRPRRMDGSENYLGKSERNNNGGDVIGRRLNTLVPGS